jgi:protein-disulfide isomerase
VDLRRPTRAGLYAASLIGAAALAATLVLVSQLGAREAGSAERKSAVPAETTATGLAGIPQRGLALGAPNAPVTLVEYADLQCTYCGQWARQAFPELVDEYVRPGKLRIVFRGLAFVGPESETALRAALAASHQNRLWDLVELVYLNQGAENSGWVSHEFLAGLGRSIGGLDADRMLADAGSSAVDRAIADAARRARAAGVPGTPAFELGPTGGPLRRLEVESLDAAGIRPAIDALLAA